MSRPEVNFLGKYLDDIGNALLRKPIKGAIRESTDAIKKDLAPLLKDFGDRMSRDMSVDAATAATGSVVGGLAAGGIGAAGGMLGALLGAAANNYTQKVNNMDLAQELLTGGNGPYQIQKLLEEERAREAEEFARQNNLGGF